MTMPGQGELHDRNLVTFDIRFTNGGYRVASWTGYYSYAEAKRAIQDADLIIPLNWNYEIVTVTLSGAE